MARKKLEFNDYLNAYHILHDNFFAINTCDLYFEDEFPLHSKIPSVENLYIKKESFESLSNEAKEIITDILNSPNELIDLMLTPSRRILTKKSIRKYFASLWQSKFIADQAIKEISKWVNQL